MAPDRLYQYSTASALMAGIASQGIRLSDLLLHGTYGLGTMTNINGEVVILEGTAYHLQSSGAVRVVKAEEQLPFAMVTSFESSTRKHATLPGLSNKQSLLGCLQNLFRGVTNRFVFFVLSRIHCDQITVRVVRGQQYPRQPLSELGDTQKINSYQNVVGSVVGIWSPEYMNGVSVGGLHMHFLSDCLTYGGHVLELEVNKEISLEAAVLDSFDLELPQNKEFDQAKLEIGGEALRKVEG